MLDVSTNEWERAARTRKVRRMADTAVSLCESLGPEYLDHGLVAEFWAIASDEQWEVLENMAGTRPQKTQDLPCSLRTRQRVVNAILAQKRSRERVSALQD